MTSELLSAIRNQKPEATVKYDALVTRLIQDESVENAEAITIVNNAGKSADDLERAVTKGKRLLELHAIIADEPTIKAKQLELNEEYATRRKALEDQINTLSRQLHTEGVEYHQQSNANSVTLKSIRDARLELNQLTKSEEPEITNRETHQFTQDFQKLNSNLSPQRHES